MADKKPRFGFNAEPELKQLPNGSLQLRKGIRLGFTKCFTCNNECGIRFRVDEATDTITRVAGNPYNEVVTGGQPLPLSVSVEKAYASLMGESGLTHRATTCGKGAAGLNAVTDPRRVLNVLKRAGKRGEDKWTTISYEQALKEILEGGNLFGEGQVEGLRAIRDLKTLIDPNAPEFGPKANQLMTTWNEEDTLRGNFYNRFMTQCYGTVNLTTKHAYCGAPVGVGFSLGMGPEVSAWAADVDWNNFEYAIFMGTSPGSSGASINRLGRGLSSARVDREAKYVCVDPILRTTVANNTAARWQPILPGTDTAFLMGVVGTILKEKRYNEKFLVNPNEAAAKAAGEVNWTNATHLVDYANQTMADAADFGVGEKGENVVVVDGKLVSAAKAGKATLFVDGTFKNKAGKDVKLISSLGMLKREVERHSMSDLAKRCGATIKEMQTIAREFTSHGRRVAAITNTGNNTPDAIMPAWLLAILNSLVGSHDAKGGAYYTNFAFFGYDGQYNLGTVEGGVDTSAYMNACRNAPYEDSSEYKNHVKKGENPYPAKHVYHPMLPGYTAGNAAEMFTALTNGDPYRAKALINWRSNVLYNASSIDAKVTQALADPKVLPLFVSIDAFINETSRYADYIIPDRVMFEEYACDRTWGNYHQCVTAGVPAVTPRTAKNKRGQHICMEEFLIDLGLAMNLPGIGKNALEAKGGKKVDLLTFDAWHARYLANVAMQFDDLPKVTNKDRELAGLNRAMDMVRPYITKEEAVKVEALLSRGGYYAKGERYSGEFMSNAGGKFLQFFNPAMPQIKHCYSGKAYPGVPRLEEHRFFNGDAYTKHWSESKFPLKLSSFKPILRSNYSVAFDRCVEISPENFVQMHVETAQKLGLKDGDKVRIVSGNGVPAEGVLKCDKGVAKGAVCVAHGYGHTAFGAEDRIVDGKKVPGLKARAGGIAVNQLIPHDPTRIGKASMLNDYYVAAVCRQGIPVRVEKI